MIPSHFDAIELSKKFYSDGKNYMKCCDFISAISMSEKDIPTYDYHQLTVFLNPAIKTCTIPTQEVRRLNYYFLISVAAQIVKGERKFIFGKKYDKESRKYEYAVFCDRNYKKINDQNFLCN